MQGKISGFPRRTGTLEIAFSSIALRTICESEANATHKLGPKVAEVLKHRLADLRAATSVMDLVVGRPRILEDSDHQRMTVDLCDGFRIIFSANHPNKPVSETGELDWTKVSRIKILWIERENVYK